MITTAMLERAVTVALIVAIMFVFVVGCATKQLEPEVKRPEIFVPGPPPPEPPPPVKRRWPWLDPAKAAVRTQ